MIFAFFSLAVFFHFYFWGLEDHCSVLAPFALFGIDVSLFFFSFLFSVFFFPKLLKMNSLSCIFFLTTLYWQRLTRQRSGFVTLVVVDFRTWQTLRNRGAKKKKERKKGAACHLRRMPKHIRKQKKKKQHFLVFCFFLFHFLFLRFPCPFFITIVFFFFSLREVTLL